MVIITTIFEKRKKSEREAREGEIKYKYKFKYIDLEIKGDDDDDDGKGIIESVVMKEERVRGFSFSDVNGIGYFYPLKIDDDDEEGEESDDIMNEYLINGKCSCCVECLEDNNNNDCEDDKICINGRCLNSGSSSCGNDDECNKGIKNEICLNGECIKGCRFDNDCNNNELCMNFQCSSNVLCEDNFDCNEFDKVCINSKCIVIDDNDYCTSDNDCSNGYYCDYEYLVCIRVDPINRKERKILPAASICTLYGIISLIFVYSSSLPIIQNNIANERLNEECNEKCALNYYTFSHSEVNDVKVKKTIMNNPTFSDSDCVGKCGLNDNNNIKGGIEIENAIKYCSGLTYYAIIYKVDIIEYFNIDQSQLSGYDSPETKIFYNILSRFCKSFEFSYLYNFGGKKLKKKTKCVADKSSIQCDNHKQINVKEKGSKS